MNLEEIRNAPAEQVRISNLLSLIPTNGEIALDIGARDGYLSKKLTQYFDKVIAVDLDKPDITHNRIESLQGNITQLDFSDNSFDLVLCAEVLEHIPSHLLEKACQELSRVTKRHLLIGVPYNQDIRLGRTTCTSCGKKNPPWGHVNRFDFPTLENLFPGMAVEKAEYIGRYKYSTNFLSVFFMDLAGNPYGTYGQIETCIHCGKTLCPPSSLTFFQRFFSKLALYINKIQYYFIEDQAKWLHVLFVKSESI